MICPARSVKHGPFGGVAEHEPLGELVAYGETEHCDEVTGNVELLEEPNSSHDPKVLDGRLCVCKHCHLVYWEPDG